MARLHTFGYEQFLRIKRPTPTPPIAGVEDAVTATNAGLETESWSQGESALEWKDSPREHWATVTGYQRGDHGGSGNAAVTPLRMVSGISRGRWSIVVNCRRG